MRISSGRGRRRGDSFFFLAMLLTRRFGPKSWLFVFNSRSEAVTSYRKLTGTREDADRGVVIYIYGDFYRRRVCAAEFLGINFNCLQVYIYYIYTGLIVTRCFLVAVAIKV